MSVGLKECVAVVLSGLCVLMMGGLVFGISSLYPVLYREGVYEDQCSVEERSDCPVDARLGGVRVGVVERRARY